jgi:uncharacterized protein YjiS (DUF1127 family)
MEVIVTTSLQGALSAPQSSSFALILAGFAAAVRKIGQALKNRHDTAMLAELDDRMLADIGLTRSDLNDAFSAPLWSDPTDVLAERALERRKHRAPAVIQVSPPLVPQAGFSVPQTNRAARYTV